MVNLELFHQCVLLLRLIREAAFNAAAALYRNTGAITAKGVGAFTRWRNVRKNVIPTGRIQMVALLSQNNVTELRVDTHGGRK